MRRTCVPLVILALGMAGLSACSDPMSIDVQPHPPPVIDPGLEDCHSSDNWLPVTPEMKDSNALFLPAPHPETECPFYRGGWQTFLVATQPDATASCKGEPAIKCYPTVDDLFQRYNPPPAGAFAAPGAPRGTSMRAWLGDIKQAGGREILIDQNGHTLYYGIHVNQAFVDFVHENHLENAYAIQHAPPSLFFSAGIAEFKTAWQEVDPRPGQTAVDPADLATFISTTAWVPTLSQGMDAEGRLAILEDRDHPRLITVRLLAIHAVFTLPGHPEFVWASMEHTSADLSKGDHDTRAADGFRDIAPVVPADPATGDLVNPTDGDPTNSSNSTIVANVPFVLYKPGTPAKLGNVPPQEPDLVLDPVTQTLKLKNGSLAQTSIYRMFPASKSNTVKPDDAVSTLNRNVEELFIRNSPKDNNTPVDKRQYYRLLGAQWMDKPSLFDTGMQIVNDDSSPLIKNPSGYPHLNQEDERAMLLAQGTGTPSEIAIEALKVDGSDSGFSLTAGEDRMSSTAMESFTQRPDSFFNCFSCHNTLAITKKGIPLSGRGGDQAGIQLMEAKRINVSHVFSQFVLEECSEDSKNLVHNDDSTDPNGMKAVCPPFPGAAP